MTKYKVKVIANINGVEKEVMCYGVYAKNEGHAVWCAMSRVAKMDGWKGSKSDERYVEVME